MKIRYLISTAFAVNPGGTSNHAKSVIQQLAKNGIEVLPVDFMAEKIDFDTLLIFSFSYHNPDMIEKYQKAGVKIILIPIFDRTKPKWTFKVYNLFEKTPIRTLFNIRKRILDSADLVLVNCEAEKTDLIECYKTQNSKLKVLKLGINNQIIDSESDIGEELFYTKHGIKNFVIYAAAEINQRKNQIALLKAVEGTDIKVVLTGCDKILVEGFDELVSKNKNVLCLANLSLQELISAYKCARVSVSLSSSETAGLALLESAYFGCNLVVSDIPAFREYVGEIADFTSLPIDHSELLKKINSALEKPKNYSQKEFVLSNNSWQKYTLEVVKLIDGLR
jgi:glycosyltransferase involved in cell wall biosynthesis